MDLQLHRPRGFSGEADQYLPKVINSLKRRLKKAQDSLTYDSLHLPNKQLEEFAIVLVEFAEDIHNDIGIWKSYEQYNLEFFNTPIPFVLQPNSKAKGKELFKCRIQHLLWILYSKLDQEFGLSPTHQGLNQLSELITDFLDEQFSNIPHGSGLKMFLSQPNQYGWDVKRKLIWLGWHSYLFRQSFQNYVIEEHDGKIEIPIIDDFICQENTCWSGLGVIDILAATLDIADEQRSELKSWYERHAAYYKVLAIKGPIIEVVNLINDKPYTVRMNEDSDRFDVRQIVSGSLVPWNKEWYWSGNQMVYDDVNKKIIQELKSDFFQKASRIAYRYCTQNAQQARERVKALYDEFVKYHGDDFVIYPDGLSMAAAWQKQYRLQYESQPKEAVSKIMKEHNLEHPWPDISLPPEFTESKNGLGVYYNPDEGQEIMLGFNDVVNGLKKKGLDLNEDDGDSIRELIFSDSISPGFVNKLVQKYGDESIASVFFIDKSRHKYYLNYLLRRYKGHFYRNRYPSISFLA